MRRIIFKSAVILSVLLMLATAGLWVRGYFARDGIWHSTEQMRYSLHSYRGRIFVWTLSVAPNPSAMTWATPTKMGRGWVVDSVPDSWYAPYVTRPKGVNLEADISDAPSMGLGSVDKRVLGFRYVSNNAWLPLAQLQFGYPTARSRAIFVPHWAVILLLAVIPGVWLFQAARNWNRREAGHCRKCGYDLRATPGKCPECGLDQ